MGGAEGIKGESSFLLSLKILAGAGTLALAACGNASSGHEANTGAPKATTAIESSQPVDGTKAPRLVFDDLGGGSSIIQVYPGVSDSDRDRTSNGTFNDGDAVDTNCKLEGRWLSSHPEQGEESRSSNMWISIKGSPGKKQFATAVYVKNPDALLEQLHDC